VRIGGIYALERIARDSARDHPTVMEVLTAFVREHSPLVQADVDTSALSTRSDVQAAVTVIGRRDRRYDHQPVNLMAVALVSADLAEADLTGAILAGADLTGANLIGANLTRADLTGVDLSDTDLSGANLTAAVLARADLIGTGLTDANLLRADLRDANLTGTNLSRAVFTDADLTSVSFGPHGADAAGIVVYEMPPRRVDLKAKPDRKSITHARLRRARVSTATSVDFTDAKFDAGRLRNVDLTGVDLTSADFRHTDLTGAIWPVDVAAPGGWQRDTASSRLERADTNSGRSGGKPELLSAQIRAALERRSCRSALKDKPKGHHREPSQVYLTEIGVGV